MANKANLVTLSTKRPQMGVLAVGGSQFLVD